MFLAQCSQRATTSARRLSVPGNAVNIRFLTSEVRTVSYAYECSSFTDPLVDKVLLEKSVMNGCRSVIGRTRQNPVELYEHLLDLSGLEELDLQEFQLGHIVKAAYDVGTQSFHSDALNLIKLELLPISKTLKCRGGLLDFVTVDIPLDSASSSGNLSRYLDNWDARVYFDKLSTVINDSGSNGTASIVGFNLSTGSLCTLTDKQMLKLIDRLTPLVNSSELKMMTVACNPLTHSTVKPLLEWAALSSVSVIATEVLRCHSAKPGLLACGDRHALPHRMTPPGLDGFASKPVAVVNGTKEDAQAMVAAVEDFQFAMDRCMQIEKIFLDKVCQDMPSVAADVIPTDVCLAHVLANTHDQFVYPEEWEYIVQSRVKPRLDAALKLLHKKGSAAKDWESVYRPCAMYLISSFRHLLEEKSNQLSFQAHKILTTSNSIPAADTIVGSSSDKASRLSVFDLGRDFANFTALWTNANCVALARTQINTNSWTDPSGNEPYVQKTPNNTGVEATATCDALRDLYNQY